MRYCPTRAALSTRCSSRITSSTVQAAAQVVAAEGGAQHPVYGGELGADEDSPDGESVAHALGHGDEVGAYAGMLVGKELARAAVA